MSAKKWLVSLMVFVVPLFNYAQTADKIGITPSCDARAPIEDQKRLSQQPATNVSSIAICGVTSDKIYDAIPELIAAVLPALETEEDKNVTVSSAELQELRARLTDLYIEQGFVTSGVILHDQSISEDESGEKITYTAIEGDLPRYEFEGNNNLSSGYIQKRLERQIEKPVQIDDIKYALRFLQNDPNIARIDARLNPDDIPGQSVLRIDVEESPQFSLLSSFNNHRATSTGEEQGGLSFGVRSLTGHGEFMSFSTGVTDGADNKSVGLTVPINSRNTNLQIYARDSDSSIVQANLRELDIESQTETRGIKLSLPLFDILDDSVSQSLSLSLGYETLSSETTLGGTPFSLSPGAQNGKAETNAALLGIDWNRRNANYVLSARLNFRHGGDYQGATIFRSPDDRLNRPFNPTGADGRFNLVQTQALYRHRAGRGQFEMRAYGQFSDDPLMSIEKIAIGGVNTVRGYAENFLVRDNGVAVSIEYLYPVFGTTASPPGIRNLSIVPFLDYGQSWDKVNTNQIDSFADTSKRNAIGSLGAGLLWLPIEGIRAEIFWGADLYDNLRAGQDPRDFRDSNYQDKGIHFALSYSKTW